MQKVTNQTHKEDKVRAFDEASDAFEAGASLATVERMLKHGFTPKEQEKAFWAIVLKDDEH